MGTHISVKLADWEVAELWRAWKGGASVSELAKRARMSGRRMMDVLRRFDAACDERGMVVR